MAKQAVSTRIPQFSRIPQIAQTAPQLPQKPSAEITSKHIGCRVKAGEKQGVLRYIGSVNFAKGTWCGVELSSEIGKNDGSVNGVRYFECAPRCGVITPLCKVTLIEAQDDEDSGPYSMLFLQAKTERNVEEINVKLNETYEKVDDANETFFIEESGDLNQTVVLSKPICNNDTYQVKNTITEAENNLKRKTFNLDLNKKSENKNTFVSSNTFDIINKTETQLNRSLENLPNEAKRRKINNQNSSETAILDHSTSSPSSLDLVVNHSTPTKVEPLKFDLRKVRISGITLEANDKEDDRSKRDSLDFEESLGILTPDQMVEDYIQHLKLGFEAQQEKDKTIENDKTLSPKDFSLGILEDTIINNVTRRDSNCSKYINKISSNELFLKFKLPGECKEPDISSPNLVDASVTEYSLGILDEHLLSNMSANLALPLEKNTDSKDYRLSRIEQTPSPEDLPLDPTPVVTIQEDTIIIKEDPKTKPLNSFITSITSITSLDTGYQGDGEMSRPASRGADNSPMTRRPLPKPQNHRQDPMTDSDFYTESDADNHDDHHLKGDRKAQVIDGTLYGVDAQAAADIYANNRENMDSSGIFTDAEINTRTEDLNETFDVSPSDTSIKTVSENSQKKQENTPKITSTPSKQTISKRTTLTPNSTPSLQSPKSSSKESSFLKKHKMPKRDVPSKIKTMLVPNQSPVPSERKTVKKAGKWDAVMDKISKNEQNKNNLKDVKSKVFISNVAQNDLKVNKSAEKNLRQTPNNKTPNSKLTNVKPKSLTMTQILNNNIKNNQISKTSSISKLQSRTNKTVENNRSKISLSREIKPKTNVPKTVKTDTVDLNLRRTRVRTSNAANTPRKNLNLESSIHSSLSDVSSPAQQLSKKNSEKKKLISTPDVKTKKKIVSANEKKTESPKTEQLYTNPDLDISTSSMDIKEEPLEIEETVIKEEQTEEIHINFAQECINDTIRFLRQFKKSNVTKEIMFLENLKEDLYRFE